MEGGRVTKGNGSAKKGSNTSQVEYGLGIVIQVAYGLSGLVLILSAASLRF